MFLTKSRMDSMSLFAADAESQGSMLALFVGTAVFEVDVKQPVKRLDG